MKSLLPRLDTLLFILLFFSVLAGGLQLLNTDGDLPRHLLMGKYVLENGMPPRTEIFAYPYAGREYIPHEWLAGVLFHLAYLLFNLNGVVFLAGILISGTFTLIYNRATTNNLERLLSFVLILLGAVVTSIHWVARPHLFTMLILAVWLILLDRLNRGEKPAAWAFPVLMLFWANLHAEYIAGFLALLAYLAGTIWSWLLKKNRAGIEIIKTLLGVTVMAFIASLINPSGLKAWTTIAGYINNAYLMSRITETRPPDLFSSESVPLLALVVLSVLLIAGNRDKLKPADVLLLTGFALMSMLSARNAHLFGVAAPIVLSHGLKGMRYPQPLKNVGDMVARLEKHARGSILAIFFTLVLAVLLLAFPFRNYNRFDPAVFPVSAVEWLKDHPQQGRMFNAFDWGGYILFHLWPEQQVFIESQTDTDGEVTQLYESVITLSPEWKGILSNHGITWTIIPPGWKLAGELRNAGWIPVYEDATAVILVEQ